MMLKRLIGRLWLERVADRFGTTAERGAPPDPLDPRDLFFPEQPVPLRVTLVESPRAALADAFTPTRPQGGAAHLVGRDAQLSRILGALCEERAHVVLYGERGRGKTSLANLVAEVAREAGLIVARFSCSAETDFDAIIRGLARDMPRALLPSVLPPGLAATEAAALEGCEAALPAARLQPRDVLALARQQNGRLVLVVDEFDRVTEEATRTRLADAVKLASDAGAPLSFLVVGVSDSLDQLLGRHPSIQRNVVGVPLPLLLAEEVEKIVARGARQAGLGYPAAVRAGIAALACGVPYMAQLLGLRAGQAALDRRARSVSGEDLAQAIARVVAEADPRLGAQFEALTDGPDGGAMYALLLAIATGERNEFGQFRAVPAGEGGLQVAGAEAPIAPWTRLLEAGVVRPCAGPGSGLFAFGEATMASYILLRAVRDQPWPPLAVEEDGAPAAAT